MVSIHRPLGYGPSTLPLRHSALQNKNVKNIASTNQKGATRSLSPSPSSCRNTNHVSCELQSSFTVLQKGATDEGIFLSTGYGPLIPISICREPSAHTKQARKLRRRVGKIPEERTKMPRTMSKGGMINDKTSLACLPLWHLGSFPWYFPTAQSQFPHSDGVGRRRKRIRSPQPAKRAKGQTTQDSWDHRTPSLTTKISPSSVPVGPGASGALGRDLSISKSQESTWGGTRGTKTQHCAVFSLETEPACSLGAASVSLYTSNILESPGAE
ncbi:uncharacterized protein LOC114035151 [Vombatus ursinus]|uniref:uncharacterized protein LOC114035151 n=1 Tax=Vombatus ursinus TaxID=29139 RepID=UPI000FFD43A9|nr:uncharacterized protein LOC114035151 [Vombatus ursinus]